MDAGMDSPADSAVDSVVDSAVVDSAAEDRVSDCFHVKDLSGRNLRPDKDMAQWGSLVEYYPPGYLSVHEDVQSLLSAIGPIESI